MLLALWEGTVILGDATVNFVARLTPQDITNWLYLGGLLITAIGTTYSAIRSHANGQKIDAVKAIVNGQNDALSKQAITQATAIGAQAETIRAQAAVIKGAETPATPNSPAGGST